MGAVYNVYLKIKVKDEHGAISALKVKIDKCHDEHTNYGVEKFVEEGVGTESIDDLIRIFLAGWKKNMFNHRVDDGWDIYSNDFNACYGLERVMIEMFQAIAPYLEEQSIFYIEPDNDYDEFIIRNRKCIQLH